MKFEMIFTEYWQSQITYLQNIPKNACVDFDASKIDCTSLF